MQSFKFFLLLTTSCVVVLAASHSAFAMELDKKEGEHPQKISITKRDQPEKKEDTSVNLCGLDGNFDQKIYLNLLINARKEKNKDREGEIIQSLETIAFHQGNEDALRIFYNYLTNNKEDDKAQKTLDLGLKNDQPWAIKTKISLLEEELNKLDNVRKDKLKEELAHLHFAILDEDFNNKKSMEYIKKYIIEFNNKDLELALTCLLKVGSKEPWIVISEMVLLGRVYEIGEVFIIQNYKKAHKWFEKAINFPNLDKIRKNLRPRSSLKCNTG